MVDALEPLPPRAADALPPAVRAGLAALPAAGPDPRHRRHATVRAALTGLAADRPVLLVLDDLHWADGGTWSCSPTCCATRGRRRCCSRWRTGRARSPASWPRRWTRPRRPAG